MKNKTYERKFTVSENQNIKLEQVDLSELPQFTKKLQEAFSVAVKEKFGTNDPIPSEKDINSSFYAEGSASYHIVLNEKRVGGAILVIDEKTQHNSLDLFLSHRSTTATVWVLLPGKP